MVFSSLELLCIFFPITYILHLLLPGNKARNILLVIASLLFYAYGEPVYVLLMIISVLLNYTGALLISKRNPRFFLILTIVTDIGILCIFKYTSFLIQTINNAAGLKIHDPAIALPVGISFFTFQAMSYVIDVYREKVEVQSNYLKLFLYISFFPQLIAGPIVKYRDIAEAIDNRTLNSEDTAEGLRRFICGLGKKVLIANSMGLVADNVFSSKTMGFYLAWIGAVAYMFQIYYDFSGYSDMAIGMGKMFGFHFRENFRYPYAASNIQEFWRRWHISLSSWFREYVYIPLGGNRRGRPRTVINKMIVFFLTGLWHGANWTFVFWGLYHGFFLLLEEYVPVIRKLPKLIGTIYTALVVCLGFVMFRADSIRYGFMFIKNMFWTGNNSREVISLAWQQLTPWFVSMLILAIIGAGPIQIIVKKFRQKESIGGRLISAVTYPLSIGLFIWCLLRLSGNSYNPFIYFRF